MAGRIPQIAAEWICNCVLQGSCRRVDRVAESLEILTVNELRQVERALLEYKRSFLDLPYDFRPLAKHAKKAQRLRYVARFFATSAHHKLWNQNLLQELRSDIRFNVKYFNRPNEYDNHHNYHQQAPSSSTAPSPLNTNTAATATATATATTTTTTNKKIASNETIISTSSSSSSSSSKGCSASPTKKHSHSASTSPSFHEVMRNHYASNRPPEHHDSHRLASTQSPLSLSSFMRPSSPLPTATATAASHSAASERAAVTNTTTSSSSSFTRNPYAMSNQRSISSSNRNNNSNSSKDNTKSNSLTDHERSLMFQLRLMGFSDQKEILEGIRHLQSKADKNSTQTDDNDQNDHNNSNNNQDDNQMAVDTPSLSSDAVTSDEVMYWIISQREEKALARQMDEARIQSEALKKQHEEMAKREREDKLNSAALEDLLTKDFFPQSIILKCVISNKLKHGRSALLKVLEVEKQAYKWYNDLPKSYMQNFCNRLKNFQRHRCIDEKLNQEYNILQCALYTLSEQQGGVPKIFLRARDEADRKRRHAETIGGDSDTSDCNDHENNNDEIFVVDRSLVQKAAKPIQQKKHKHTKSKQTVSCIDIIEIE